MARSNGTKNGMSLFIDSHIDNLEIEDEYCNGIVYYKNDKPSVSICFRKSIDDTIGSLEKIVAELKKMKDIQVIK